MPENHVIEFLSSEWIRNTSFTVLIILLYLLIGKFLKTNDKLKFAKIISIILIITTLTGHSRNIINGYWNISENLPLQLCGISNLIGCFILFIPKNKTLFEFFYYTGIIGAIQAFLTPQINNFDGTNYEYVEYYISHGGILLLPIYMINNLGYKLRKFSWLKVLIYLNILLIFIMPLNFKIN